MHNSWMKLVFFYLIFGSIGALANIKAGTASFAATSADSRDFLSAPLLLAPLSGQSRVVLFLDQSLDMSEFAYGKAEFEPSLGDGQQGYFNPASMYQYERNFEAFIPAPKLKSGDEGAWDGRFLNWLTMRKVDIARMMLTGGRLRFKKNTGARQASHWFLEGYEGPKNGLVISRSSSNSDHYSPVPANSIVSLKSGKIKFGKRSLNISVRSSDMPAGMIQRLEGDVSFSFYNTSQSLTSLPAEIISTINEANLYKSNTVIESDIERIYNAIVTPSSSKKDSFQDSAQANILACKQVSILSIVANSPSLPLSEYPKSDIPTDCRNDLEGEQKLGFYSLSARLERSGLNSQSAARTESDNQAGTHSKNDYSAGQIEELIFQLKVSGVEFDDTNAHRSGAVFLQVSPKGEGALYETSYTYHSESGGDSAYWLGDLSALMVDKNGLLRSDNGNRKINSFAIDPIIDTCFSKVDHRLRVKLSTSLLARPGKQDKQDCSVLVFSKEDDDIGYLWQAEDVLSKLRNRNVDKQRRPYSSSSLKRYVRTNIGGQEIDFTEDSFSRENLGLLNASSLTDAQNLIRFIRGLDQQGARNRTVEGITKRLGDFVHSSPVAVGKPSENNHLLYNDKGYLAFFEQYRDRRTMVFAGGNDGMLHAFNGGWFDELTRQFTDQKKGYSQWTLGQESWAFIPYNLLPHLKHLSRPDYGKQVKDHSYFVDQTPYVFDANIFAKSGRPGQPDRQFYDSKGKLISSTTHPNGWGTVLVVGFGRGGGKANVHPNPRHSELTTVQPAFLIFDITDPEQAPVLMAEFTHEKLAASLSEPTALTLKNHKGEFEWFLAMGSGPSSTPKGMREMSSEQNAHILMINLNTMRLENSFARGGILDLKLENSFVGDMVAADFDLDASTDALYFGTAINSAKREAPSDLGGRLFRLRVGNGASGGRYRWNLDEMFDANAPIVSKPSISFDDRLNRWIHFGTGRLMAANDLVDNRPGFLYGLKEPRHNTGTFLMDVPSKNIKPIKLRQLIDVSKVNVSQSGFLSGQLNISPPLAGNTAISLEERLGQYQNSVGYQSGWVKKLREFERGNKLGAILGGFYSQSTFLPRRLACKMSGSAFLYNLRYTTGTAWFKRGQQSSSAAHFSTSRSIDHVLTGTAPSRASLLQLGPSRGEGVVTRINLSDDGEINANKEHGLESIQSGEISWREL